jgi:hypothetical protein
VIRILHTDPVTTALLGDSSFRVKFIAAWQTAAATELQGGVATLTQIDPPANIDHVRVPFINEPFNGRPNVDPCLRYLQRSAVLTASGVAGMEVWVDLRKSEVVQIGSTPLSGNDFRFSDERGPEPSAAYKAPPGY